MVDYFKPKSLFDRLWKGKRVVHCVTTSVTTCANERQKVAMNFSKWQETTTSGIANENKWEQVK